MRHQAKISIKANILLTISTNNSLWSHVIFVQEGAFPLQNMFQFMRECTMQAQGQLMPASPGAATKCRCVVIMKDSGLQVSSQ
jgi:hypothetical protein